jgi:chloride channel 3/4/5
MTISLTVVLYELTGAVSSVLSIMIAVMVSKFTGDFLARDGIYESWIKLRSYPFLDPKVEYRKDTAYARDIMTPVEDLVYLEQQKEWTVGELEDFIRQHEYRGYPIVQSEKSTLVCGYVVRNDLIEALAKARVVRGIFGTTRCSFMPRDNQPDQPGVLDLASWMDQTPMTMSVNSTGEIVVQLFQRMVR